ncbi:MULTISPECIES: arabinosyltransferase domain-containing protein [Mycobacterium]|uniref:Arabinosyltransferase A n=1 Tax=Mycobacterium kiyosense TaxID=2871094 RepID=A0A9P3QAU9_9MYCO|nr:MULTISPECIES: arabinosyltransferase domain-containing protein [Mycobacterium]BDB45691.1 putative arabinosyltransferase A [Mycobacterium kiyosense]BDE11306.1 putative arabinosyltransferase A [Mycobacterium sp. 20KCMC460]GLB84600.1 putative arabinosyltransferase A [Mycobacterium kiyosense]GLB91267.1 putative arabinosyltransferase A [Mycobacterium kiyosense]GLB97716.1 putative arabinosyltransferase A [Mycobacterium kiyosense]
MSPDGNERSHRVARLLAVVSGIAGLLLCLLVPLLPVRQTTATIFWPQGADADGNISQITAPLVSGAPRSLDISLPCSAIATLPADGGLVLSTLPTDGFETGKHGLFVRANKDSVVVAFRDTVAAAAPRAAIAAGTCQRLHVWADAGGAGADFEGIPNAAGKLSPEKKPQVGGIFTDLKVRAQPGLSARVDVDTRFILAPTTLKTLAMGLGVLAILVAIGALGALDRLSRGEQVRNWRSPIAWLARYRPRLHRSRIWRVGLATWLADAGVIATLLGWHVIGAISSDDGYNLTIARVAPKAGYVANYYRYFGTTDAPFDWYLSVLAKMAAVSTAGVWMRLPATLAGIACWLIISRCVLRRLGPGVNGLAANRVAVWTAGAVFVAAWLPFNNGLRPEPLIALGVLATWMMVERSIALARLAAAAVAIIVAVFTVTLAPQGLIAVAPLLTGARAIAQTIRRRRPTDGVLAPLAVLAASGSLIFVVVFRSQTLATVAESARIKYTVGPTIAWYQDFLRYYFLTVESNADGSMARRFAALILLLCMFGMLFVLLRRGRVPGLATGPAWRLIGTTAIGLLLLTFTPTKWAIQFGIFAGLAGALGAVTGFSVARIGLHSRRNLALYVTALLFVLAWATSGINGWFYVGNYGVPWYDIQPVVASHPVTSMFLMLSILTGLLAAWYHFRMDYAGHTEVKNNRRNRVLASTPLLVVAVIMVLGEVGSMAKGAVFRYPLYTTGKANLRAIESGLSPNSCAMADDVLAEPDSNAGMLQPVPGQQFGPDGPLGGVNPVGFKPEGVGENLQSDPVISKPGVVNSDASPNKPNAAITDSAGTAGGKGPVGVNGSHAALPFGLDPARTPVMGSYGENALAARATSAWYQLPPRRPDRPLVVVSAAGAIWSYKEDGDFMYGQSLKLQWGVAKPDGSIAPLGEVFPIDLGPQPAWRNLRFPFLWAPPEANVARIVAYDPNLSSEQWFAFTPPRVPELEPLQQLIGSQNPVLMDIATAANFPCQRPFTEHLGIAELPQYRILPDHKQTAVSSNLWQSAGTGGPFMFTQALLWTSTISTYLSGDWYRDWGSVEQYHRLVPADKAPEATVNQGVVTVPGWSRQGPIRALP